MIAVISRMKLAISSSVWTLGPGTISAVRGADDVVAMSRPMWPSAGVGRCRCEWRWDRRGCRARVAPRRTPHRSFTLVIADAHDTGVENAIELPIVVGMHLTRLVHESALVKSIDHLDERYGSSNIRPYRLD